MKYFKNIEENTFVIVNELKQKSYLFSLSTYSVAALKTVVPTALISLFMKNAVEIEKTEFEEKIIANLLLKNLMKEIFPDAFEEDKRFAVDSHGQLICFN